MVVNPICACLQPGSGLQPHLARRNADSAKSERPACRQTAQCGTDNGRAESGECTAETVPTFRARSLQRRRRLLADLRDLGADVWVNHLGRDLHCLPQPIQLATDRRHARVDPFNLQRDRVVAAGSYLKLAFNLPDLLVDLALQGDRHIMSLTLQPLKLVGQRGHVRLCGHRVHGQLRAGAAQRGETRLEPLQVVQRLLRHLNLRRHPHPANLLQVTAQGLNVAADLALVAANPDEQVSESRHQ
jgi:hypothetical protein